ncbi:Thioredoxin-like protein 1 [Chionoecetes opilio]|uniref:Thioredoxin-like protein 1 n=1 Tax=Chionoecetes opilio TaxID=41210 RepID=A0A8J5CXP6_CHIOP|nr:Thioredoxin-like protein 1 [Chionoecetes opilio]
MQPADHGLTPSFEELRTHITNTSFLFTPQLCYSLSDFVKRGCGPCQRIAPVFEEMARRFSNAIFLKVDVNQCPTTSASQGVTSAPTFIFFRNKTKLDSLRGADPEGLEARIRQHYGDGEEEEVEDSGVPGHIDLMPMITKSGCECLNESDDHPFTQALASSEGYMESDTDEQLILCLEFNQAVKLHSMRIKAPADNGPKTLKLFINQPHTIDFDTAESANPVQELSLCPKDLEGELIPLKFVKLQNVINLTIFFKDNQTGEETTQESEKLKLSLWVYPSGCDIEEQLLDSSRVTNVMLLHNHLCTGSYYRYQPY